MSIGMEKRHVNSNDLVTSSRIVELTAYKNYAAYTIKKYSLETRSSVVDIFIHDSNVGKTRQMTRSSNGDGARNPIFACDDSRIDDSILYLRSDGQIWALPLSGGERYPVTSFSLEIESFKLFRHEEDSWLLYCMSLYPATSPEETSKIDREKLAAKDGSGMVFDSLMIRHWDSWNCYEKRNHIFICRLNVSNDRLYKASSNSSWDIMHALPTDCPVRPFGSCDDYNICPEGDTVTLACRRVNMANGIFVQPRDMAWSTEVSIYTIDISSVVKNINNINNQNETFTLQLISDPNNHATHSSPVFSPDNNKIIYLSMSRAMYESDQLQVTFYDRHCGKEWNITKDIDLSFSSLYFDQNVSKNDSTSEVIYTVYATAQFKGSYRIFKLEVLDDLNHTMSLKNIKMLRGNVTSINPLLVRPTIDSKYLYFLQSSLLFPNMLTSVSLNEEHTLDNPFETFSNDSFLSSTSYSTHIDPFDNLAFAKVIHNPCCEFSNGEIIMPQIQQYYFPTILEDGSESLEEKVHCWYLPPANIPTNEDDLSPQSVPLVLIIHGGPQGAILNNWNYRWNCSYFSSLGYGVVAVNFHGSTGYGQKYVDSIRTDWGGQPFRDCIGGVDFILNEKKYLNPDKVGALGASYGGNFCLCEC